MNARRIARRVIRATIWGPNGVDENDERLRLLLRVGLPVFDLACILFGVGGFVGGIPALRQTFGEDYAQQFGLTLAVTAAVCLVGISRPDRLYRLEFYGKCLLLGLLLVYAGAVLWAGLMSGDIGRAAVGPAIIATSVLPWWRVVDISRDRRVHGWT